jgi:hypothetical protein
MPIENKPHRASPSALAHLDGLRPSGCNGVRRMSRRPETLIQAQNEIEIFANLDIAIYQELGTSTITFDICMAREPGIASYLETNFAHLHHCVTASVANRDRHLLDAGC